MRPLILILSIFLGCLNKTNAQSDSTTTCPTVSVTAKLIADTFKLGKDISVEIILTNNSKSTQSVWFDKPKSSTGRPAWTSVILTDRKTGKSVLKYQNKSILQSQLYSTEEVKQYSYQLQPGQKVSGKFSLLDLVVLLDYKRTLDKGTYDMQMFYCDSPSRQLSFTVD
ncbi:hypothetical protein [Hymenobacter sp. B81]|uniref:hypothetical protein n=1 Tax=Hymenobacter sp. B81 TaxID=3344878 RepID=UPI0037DD480A